MRSRFVPYKISAIAIYDDLADLLAHLKEDMSFILTFRHKKQDLLLGYDLV